MLKGENQNKFPSVQGKNLERMMMFFPGDFHSPLNLVFIAFQQWQQTSVNTWLQTANALCAERDDFSCFEFPVIDKLNPLSRWFINEGMRAGIHDQQARERTITLYLDKEAFRDALAIEDERQITLLLCDAGGHVLWRAQGEWLPENETSLLTAIQAYHSEVSQP